MDDDQQEEDFYEGKVAAAKFFVNFILPGGTSSSCRGYTRRPP
jgi:hypothetical protein